MATPINFSFTAELEGASDQGPLEPVSLEYVLENQKAHSQQSVRVLPTDVAKVISLGLAAVHSEPGDVQTFFLMKSSHKINFTLNGGGPIYEIPKPNGFFLLVGSPEVVTIEFTGFPSVTAIVHITKIIGAP
jgi:hypothetical protein